MEGLGGTFAPLPGWPNDEFVEASVCILFTCESPFREPHQEDLGGGSHYVAVARMTAQDLTVLICDCHVKMCAILCKRSG
ncbi:MAG: hypothetical protein JWL63_792 [Rhodocyclales bacterium]|nr:hypothetical protein [Rhodocyclales bacterium]